MFNRFKIYSFAKAQLSAFIGGMVDYSLMLICTEILAIHYTISIVIGGIIGAVVNFSLNRYWSFSPIEGYYQASLQKQLIRFIPVVLGSIFLKSSGTYLVTSYTKIDYRVSRLLVELMVSLGFNYVLQKKWVFKHKSSH
ncbi:MAG: GtrA family protein [Pedobacter sp.]|nr:MAG: GtrA family protein [Pedobacter sp.]